MRLIFSLLLLACLLPHTTAIAQEGSQLLLNEQSNLTIDLNPPFPKPDESFTATINDYALPTQSINLRWRIDGAVAPEYTNTRTIQLISPSAGESLTLTVITDLANGTSIETSKTITPVYLDIILEPQTRTPSFYKGRAIPSFSSVVNATALVNGNPAATGNYIYTWRINNTVIEGGSIRGRNTTTFTMPRGQSATLGLQVQRVGGEVIANRLISVFSQDPQIYFYENNPLYGLKERAINQSFALTGSTVNIKAEPYYIDLRVFNSPDLLTWEIDGAEQPRNYTNPYEITLAAFAPGGRSTVEFEVRDTTQVLQGARGSFQVTY